MDPNELAYATQALAWALVWSAAGWRVRQLIAARDVEREHRRADR